MIHGTICGRSRILSRYVVRPSTQLFAEINDIWERKLDNFEKYAIVDPLHLIELVEVKLIHQMLEFTTTQAHPSKEMELKCLERFESILTGSAIRNDSTILTRSSNPP